MGLHLLVRDLSVRIDTGRTILALEELSVRPGECIGVRGPSGAGKSTLLFALAGMIDQAAGTVRWGNDDIIGLSEVGRAAFRRSRVGLVFQDFLLFEELSAMDNAAVAGFYAPPETRMAIRRRAQDMLERLGLGGTGRRSVETFSGGERQRVAVARALAHDPDVILADEPTANLDRTAADSLAGDLIRLARDNGTTLLAVSHDSALLARMDRVVDLADGRLVHLGSDHV